MYKKGDVVVAELYEEAVKILDVRLDETPFPWGKVFTWEYKVKSPDTGKMVWIDDQQITGQVKYRPVYTGMTCERHVELCQDLGEYENLRDWLETLRPRSKHDKLSIKALKEILEVLALNSDGDHKESHDAQEMLEQILR